MLDRLESTFRFVKSFNLPIGTVKLAYKIYSLNHSLSDTHKSVVQRLSQAQGPLILSAFLAEGTHLIGRCLKHQNGARLLITSTVFSCAKRGCRVYHWVEKNLDIKFAKEDKSLAKWIGLGSRWVVAVIKLYKSDSTTISTEKRIYVIFKLIKATFDIFVQYTGYKFVKNYATPIILGINFMHHGYILTMRCYKFYQPPHKDTK